ncbi:uncharacterized protein LOC117284588 [Fukomys damarensis]|uniref:uncharacterized protein LOC117284588 n=1 Tax=Fukomys damarensis TaxID=885580 RepID=UPI0014559943|nr:uncharacterized protein LOC117284588 [Fukomys damarensis]
MHLTDGMLAELISTQIGQSEERQDPQDGLLSVASPGSSGDTRSLIPEPTSSGSRRPPRPQRIFSGQLSSPVPELSLGGDRDCLLRRPLRPLIVHSVDKPEVCAAPWGRPVRGKAVAEQQLRRSTYSLNFSLSLPCPGSLLGRRETEQRERALASAFGNCFRQEARCQPATFRPTRGAVTKPPRVQILCCSESVAAAWSACSPPTFALWCACWPSLATVQPSSLFISFTV